MKKRYFLIIAAAFLAGMATSCVDMPESKGIDEAYAARVDFIKAQTILKSAETKLKEAKVATENAITMQMDARVKAQEIANKIAQARNANEKARLVLELNILQANSDRDLVYAQANLAEAQRQYQWALAQLELTKKDIPAQYQNELNNLKSRLTNLAANIAQNQSTLIGYNLSLNAYIAKDSLQLVTQLTSAVANSQRNLQMATENLNFANAAKGASGPSLEATKVAVKTRLDALNAEWKVNDVRLNTLNFEVNKAYEDYTKIINQYNRVDYRADVAIPNVNAVKIDFISYFNSSLSGDGRNRITSDTATYSYIGDLDGLIWQMQNVLSYVEGKETANPTVAAWTTLKTSVKAKLDSFTTVRGDLVFKLNNAWSAYRIKNNEYWNLVNLNNSLNTSIWQLNDLYNVLNNNLNGLDQAIANAEQNVTNAQASYNEAKVRLDTFKKNGAQEWGGWAYSQIKDIRDNIALLTKYIAEQQVEFGMLTKQMDALVVLINSQTK